MLARPLSTSTIASRAFVPPTSPARTLTPSPPSGPALPLAGRARDGARDARGPGAARRREAAPRPQHLRDAPRLRGAAAARVRRIAVGDLGDLAEARRI